MLTTHPKTQKGGGWLSARGKIVHAFVRGRTEDKNDDKRKRLPHEKIVLGHTNKKMHLHVQLPNGMNPKTQWKRDKRLSWFGEKDRMEGIIEALGDAMRHFYRHYSGKASVKNDWKNSPLYIPLGKYTKDKHNKWYKINHLTWRVDNPEHGIRRFLTPKMVRKGLFFPALRITWMLLGAGVITEGVGIIQESADILECLYNKDMILAKDTVGKVHAATKKVITVKNPIGHKVHEGSGTVYDVRYGEDVNKTILQKDGATNPNLQELYPKANSSEIKMAYAKAGAVIAVTGAAAAESAIAAKDGGSNLYRKMF